VKPKRENTIEEFVDPPAVTVNDRDNGSCWICGHPKDHYNKPHSEATGDGITRFHIVALMAQGGYTWRPES